MRRRRRGVVQTTRGRTGSRCGVDGGRQPPALPRRRRGGGYRRAAVVRRDGSLGGVVDPADADAGGGGDVAGALVRARGQGGDGAEVGAEGVGGPLVFRG